MAKPNNRRKSSGMGDALFKRDEQAKEKDDLPSDSFDVDEGEEVDLQSLPETPDAPSEEGDESDDDTVTGSDVVEGSVESVIAAIEETPVIDVPEITPPPVEPTRAAEAVVQAIETLPVVETLDKEEKVDLYAKYAMALNKDQLAAWDQGTMRLYDETGTKPDLTSRGNYAQDRRRTDELKQWTNSELLDWLEGQIPTPKTLDAEQVWDEVYRRNKIPYNWTHDALRAFLNNRTRPAETSTGVLIDDRMRDVKAVNQLSYLELRAAILGDIQTKFKKDELFKVLRRRSGVSDQFPEPRLIDSLKHHEGEISVDDTLLRSQLDEYKTVMTSNPGTLTEQTAGSAQLMLAKAIRRVMARDTVEFYEGWNILLDFINVNYPTLFTPERARKGWPYIALKGDALNIFENLMTLLIQTRNPVGRNRAAKMYNLNTILSKVTSENERNNVIGFYLAR